MKIDVTDFKSWRNEITFEPLITATINIQISVGDLHGIIDYAPENIDEYVGAAIVAELIKRSDEEWRQEQEKKKNEQTSNI